jgi:hypothetical protein
MNPVLFACSFCLIILQYHVESLSLLSYLTAATSGAGFSIPGCQALWGTPNESRFQSAGSDIESWGCLQHNACNEMVEKGSR